MTRRSLFKRFLGVVAGLCCFGKSAGAEGSEDTTMTNGGGVCYWFNGHEFICIGERT